MSIQRDAAAGLQSLTHAVMEVSDLDSGTALEELCLLLKGK